MFLFVLLFFVYLWKNISGLTGCSSQEMSCVCRAGQVELGSAAAHIIPDDLLPRVTCTNDVFSQRQAAECPFWGEKQLTEQLGGWEHF